MSQPSASYYNPDTVRHQPDVTPFIGMDNNFRLAMAAAVIAGKERPPGLKVSKTPCTQRPLSEDQLRRLLGLPQREVAMPSACWWMAEGADAGGHW